MPALIFAFLRHSEKALRWMAYHPLKFTLYSVGGTLLVVAPIYSIIEDVSFFDALWWGIVTMSTVGYGDISPTTPGVRLLAALVIATGIIATIIIGAQITARLIDIRLADAHVTPDPHDDFDQFIQQLQQLGARMRADEERDDRMAACAKRALSAHRSGDGRALERALDELEQHCREHDEKEGEGAHAETTTV